jgi:hypothetical protein
MAKDNTARALQHARTAALHAKMKGISASDVGVAFMAQALVLMCGIDPAQAARLVQHLIPLAYEYLQRDLIDNLAAVKERAKLDHANGGSA